MKKPSFILIVLIAAFVHLSCDEEETANIPPSCTITSPEDGAEFERGTIVTIKVESSDPDGDLVQVFLKGYDINEKIYGGSFNFEWDTWGVEPGSHLLKARAQDYYANECMDSITISIFDTVYTFDSVLVFNTMVDVDGNTYKTVQIDTQEWMAENLKTTRYPDGTEIPYVIADTAWINLSSDYDAYCYYNNNENGEAENYGALYTYAAANKACPQGWHLPSQREWEVLIDYVVNVTRSEDFTNCLMDTKGWNHLYGDEVNTFGFSAKGSGRWSNHNDKDFHFCGDSTGCYFWISSDSYFCIQTTESYGLPPVFSGIALIDSSITDGLSVRCIKD